MSTKAREIGRIAGFEEAGITEVRVRAVMDAKTSPVCRSMNGRIIEIQHLTAQRDDILAAKTIDQLKNAAAWPTPQQGPTKSLPHNVGIPPYHYRCRTTLMAVVNKGQATATSGSRLSPRDEATLGRFDASEHANRAMDLKAKAANLEYGDDKTLVSEVRKAQVEKHGADFGIDLPIDDRGRKIVTVEDMNRFLGFARRGVAESDEVMVRVNQPHDRADAEVQYHFFSRSVGAEVSVNEVGVIRMCDGIEPPDFDERVKWKAEISVWLRGLPKT